MKKIMVTKSNGEIAIIIPAAEATPALLERDAKAVEGYVSHQEVDDSAIPKDRTFRNAWVKKAAGGIDVDMPKARDIHMNRLRTLRSKALPKLDEQYLKADEANDQATKKAIAKQKQDLRDMPTTLDLSKATTPEDLKKIIPDILKTEE